MLLRTYEPELEARREWVESNPDLSPGMKAILGSQIDSEASGIGRIGKVAPANFRSGQTQAALDRQRGEQEVKEIKARLERMEERERQRDECERALNQNFTVLLGRLGVAEADDGGVARTAPTPQRRA